MNILAHAYLAGDDEGLIIGNFIADFIKGTPEHPRHGLSAGVQRGVWLHRQIDSFTDQHPLVEQMRILVRPRCHKYAGVAVDVFLDHFLAKDFAEITGQPLSRFVPAFYQLIRRHRDQLPEGARRMSDYMMQHDWLTEYQYLDGIDRSLKGIARRTVFPSNLDTAIAELSGHYRNFERYFRQFFPELQQHVSAFRSANGPLI